jgi:hypothetical protein
MKRPSNRRLEQLGELVELKSSNDIMRSFAIVELPRDRSQDTIATQRLPLMR